MRDVYYDTINTIEQTHWWYRVRRNIIHTLFATHIKGTNLKVLDVGCGTGVMLSELSRYGEAHGLDISSKAVAYCKERGITNVKEGSVIAIGYPDASFDVVLALDVIEHVDDDNGAIREIYRVLKPGGIAIMFVPAFMFLWGSTDVYSEHKRRYTIGELRNKLRAEQFRILRSSYFNTFLFPAIALWRLVNRLLPLHKGSEMELNNAIINRMLYRVFATEEKLLRFIPMPFGVSIMAICKKP